MFKFSDSDQKSSAKALKQHEDDLTRTLAVSVPGLVSSGTASLADNSASLTSGHVAANSVLSITLGGEDRSAASAGHRLLIKPDAFNVSVLFQPTLAFLDRVQVIMPSGTSEGSRGFGSL